MDLKLAVAADAANLTGDGKLNILGVFEEINPQTAFPYQLPQMYLAFSLSLEADDFGQDVQVRIVLSDDRGGQLAILQGGFQTPAAIPRGWALVHQAVGIAGLRFERPGTHTFRFFLDDRELGGFRMYVNEPKEEASDAG